MALLRPYQRIIGMGLPVVPLILEELQREPDQWFWALEAITEENPVPPEAAGIVNLMVKAWVDWGREQGYVPHNDLPQCFPQADRAKSSDYQPSNAGIQLHRLVHGGYGTVVAAGSLLADLGGSGGVWPRNLVEALRSLGFSECDDGALEKGFDKVALYGSGSFLYTHAARQLPSGKWTSKLGRSEDIEHDSPEDLAGGVYGEVHQYMRRPIPSKL